MMMSRDLGSSLSFTIKKNQEMTTSFSTHHSFLHLKKKNPKNNNELRGSLLSFVTKAKQPRTTMSRDLDSSSSSITKYFLVENNKELGGSLLSFAIKKNQPRTTMS
jgi:hypothetical protein